MGGAFSLCRAWAAQEDSPPGSKLPSGAGSVRAANQELEQAVHAKLDSDTGLREARLAVTADVTRNQVTLSGVVPSSALRAKAVESVREVQVGVIVVDRMEVKPNSN